MSQRQEFHNLDNPNDGLFRDLAPGLTTRIFAGEQAMLSVVTLAPHAEGTMHHHPEEQWGVLLEGSALRMQGGEEIAVKKGDFWRTPMRRHALELVANPPEVILAEGTSIPISVRQFTSSNWWSSYHGSDPKGKHGCRRLRTSTRRTTESVGPQSGSCSQFR